MIWLGIAYVVTLLVTNFVLWRLLQILQRIDEDLQRMEQESAREENIESHLTARLMTEMRRPVPPGVPRR